VRFYNDATPTALSCCPVATLPREHIIPRRGWRKPPPVRRRHAPLWKPRDPIPSSGGAASTGPRRPRRTPSNPQRRRRGIFVENTPLKDFKLRRSDIFVASCPPRPRAPSGATSSGGRCHQPPSPRQPTLVRQRVRPHGHARIKYCLPIWFSVKPSSRDHRATLVRTTPTPIVHGHNSPQRLAKAAARALPACPLVKTTRSNPQLRKSGVHRTAPARRTPSNPQRRRRGIFVENTPLKDFKLRRSGIFVASCPPRPRAPSGAASSGGRCHQPPSPRQRLRRRVRPIVTFHTRLQ